MWVSDSFFLKLNQQRGHYFFEIAWHYLSSLSCLFPFLRLLPFQDSTAQSSLILRASADTIPSASTHLPRHDWRSFPHFPGASVQMPPCFLVLSEKQLQNNTHICSLLNIYSCFLHSTCQLLMYYYYFICFCSLSTIGLQWVSVFRIVYSLPRHCLDMFDTQYIFLKCTKDILNKTVECRTCVGEGGEWDPMPNQRWDGRESLQGGQSLHKILKLISWL